MCFQPSNASQRQLRQETQTPSEKHCEALMNLNAEDLLNNSILWKPKFILSLKYFALD